YQSIGTLTPDSQQGRQTYHHLPFAKTTVRRRYDRPTAPSGADSSCQGVDAAFRSSHEATATTTTCRPSAAICTSPQRYPASLSDIPPRPDRRLHFAQRGSKKP